MFLTTTANRYKYILIKTSSTTQTKRVIESIADVDGILLDMILRIN